jgi:hypothetical protein
MSKLRKESGFYSITELTFLHFNVKNYCAVVNFETAFQVLNPVQHLEVPTY